jgi:GMP synthase (glutamine-hydrolysing)
MRVLAVIHTSDAGPELFGEVIASDGHQLVEWDIPRQGSPPREVDAVMVFGGDQNVGEEVAHPWLHEEYDALRMWVADGTPVLGVCLGGQTLAHAFGGDVQQAKAPMAGFFATELTDEGQRDPVVGVLPRRFDAFNANAYRFTVPSGAIELARGPVSQAFRYGDHAWGVQFHPEIRRAHVLRWFEDDWAGRTPAEIAAELDEKLETWQELGTRLCRAFLAQSSTGRSS